MDSHGLVVFSEEEDVGRKDDSDEFGEFKDSADPPDQETAEGIEFLEIREDDLIIIDRQIVVFLKERYEIVQLKLLTILGGTAELPVNLFYDLICDHDRFSNSGTDRDKENRWPDLNH